MPLTWLLVLWTEFRTQLEVESTETGLRLIVNGQTLEAPAKLGHLRAFSIVPSGTFFPFSARSVTILGPDGQQERYPLPRTFTFPPPSVPLTADWWIDAQPARQDVIRQYTSVPAPWKLSVTFFGRGRARVILEGDHEIVCGFRAGALDNDLFITNLEGAALAAGSLAPNPALEIRHVLYWPAAGLFMACGLILGFAAAGRVGRDWKWQPRLRGQWSFVIFGVLALNLALGLWTAYAILDARPHFQDDLGYLLRAKWLVAGRISLPKPDQAEHFNIPFTLFFKERWISQYPIGWPLVLAIAHAFHSAWIAAPLCGAMAAYATWKIGTTLADSAVGAAAAILLTLSPLNSMLSGSMLSHAATAMWLALFTWLFLRGWRQKRGWRSLGFSGVALGCAFSTRPLSGFAVGAIAGIFMLVEMKQRRFVADAWRGFVAFVVGGLLGSLPALIDNWMTTGSPTTFAYNLAYTEIWTPRAYAGGLFWVDRMVGLMPAVAFGWGWPWLASWWPLLALTFAFAAVPFLAGRATRADWLLLGIFCALPLAYIGFSAGTGLHGFGPRYFVDILFALALLTARGFQELARMGDSAVRSPAPRYLAAGLFLALAASTAVSLKKRVSLHAGYNEVDARIEKMLEKQNVTKGLILLGEPTYLNWIRSARLLPVDLRGPLVFATRNPDNSKLIRAYEGWPVYEIDERGLRAYGTNPR